MTAKQMRTLLDDIGKFEADFGCGYGGEKLDAEMRRIYREQIPLVERAGERYPWNTFWMILLKEGPTAIGSAGFKSLPDHAGKSEISYGLGPGYWNRGYATEAVKAQSQWAFSSGAIWRIVAEVERWNAASKKVLAKNGYRYFETVGSCDWYELTRVESGL